MYEIYLITNQINEKHYVGQTVKGLKTRFSRHIRAAKSGSDAYLYRAIQKYGHDRFTVSLLATAKDKEDLDRLEIFWIKTLKTKRPLGYNITEGGGGCLGLIPSEETRKRRSAANKGKFLGDYIGEKSPVFRHDLNTEHMAELYQQGKSFPQIAELLGTNSTTIRKRLKSAGVTSRSISESQKLRFSDPVNVPNYREDISTKDMISMFETGFSIQKIANNLGCSRFCVVYRLKKEGLYRPSRRVKGLRLAWVRP